MYINQHAQGAQRIQSRTEQQEERGGEKGRKVRRGMREEGEKKREKIKEEKKIRREEVREVGKEEICIQTYHDKTAGKKGQKEYLKNMVKRKGKLPSKDQNLVKLLIS